MSESKTSKRRLVAINRQWQALEMRKAGVPFDAIARQLGYGGPAGAFKAVESAIQRTLQEPADEVRKLELERLDKLLLGLWPAASKGDCRAVERVLAVMDRRARYLGLDAPAKHELTGKDGRSVEISHAITQSFEQWVIETSAFGEAPNEPEQLPAPVDLAQVVVDK
jgi:hypothetical protein